MTSYIKHIIKREALPIELRSNVTCYIQNSTQPDALLLHLHEVNVTLTSKYFDQQEVQEKVRQARYAIMFRTKQQVNQFIDGWKRIDEKKVQIEEFSVKKNILLVFLKHTVRPTMLAQQIKQYGFKPIYIFTLLEKLRSIQNQLHFCKVKFDVKWTNEILSQVNIKKKRRISPTSSVEILGDTKKTLNGRSRSQSQQAKEQSPEKPKFRNLSMDQKYEFIITVAFLTVPSKGLINQLRQRMKNLMGENKVILVKIINKLSTFFNENEFLYLLGQLYPLKYSNPKDFQITISSKKILKSFKSRNRLRNQY